MIKRILLLIGAVIFTVLFVLSVVNINRRYTDERKSTVSFESLAELVIDVPSETVTITVENVASETNQFTEPKKITPREKYTPVYEQNSDFVGWITIDDTNINYPVMQTKDKPNFYINHGFDKTSNEYGVPYVQEDCEIGGSDNVIRQRQTEGIAAAKKRGVKFGRPVKELPGDFDDIVRRWERKEITMDEILKTYVISESTFYRRLREYRLRKKRIK